MAFLVSALASGSSGPGSSTGLLRKTLYSHSTSLHPGVYLSTGERNTGGGGELSLRYTSISSKGSRNSPIRSMILSPG